MNAWKRRVRTSRRLHPVSLSILIGALGAERGVSAEVPRPLDVGSKEVLGYVAIPSLNKVLKDVSATADLFAPGQTTPEALKAQIGAMLGDPQLANMELEKPIVLLLIKAPQPGAPPSLAGMVPAKQGAPYDQALAGMGLRSKFSGGILIAGQTPDALDAAEKMKGVYDQIAGARLQKSGRIYLQIAPLMEAYGPLLEAQLDSLLRMMPAAAGAAGEATSPEQLKATAALLKLEVQGLLALLKQCQAVQVDLDLTGQSIGLDQVVTARQGTPLGDFFIASSRSSGPSSSLPEGERFLVGALSCDAKATGLLTKQLLEALASAPEGASLKGLTELFATMGEWWTGTAGFGMGPGKDVPLVLDYELGILDEAKYMASMEKAMALFSQKNILTDIYAGMGLDFSMKFEKGARQREGIAVHRVKMSLEAKDPKNPPPPEMAMMKAFVRDLEIAVVKGRALLSNDTKRLDSMIDQVRSSAPRDTALKAQKAFGPGRQGYFDYDFLALMKVMLSMMPAAPAHEPMKEVLAKMKSTEPMTFAVTFGVGGAQVQMDIPLRPFAQLVPRGQ